MVRGLAISDDMDMIKMLFKQLKGKDAKKPSKHPEIN